MIQAKELQNRLRHWQEGIVLHREARQ